jgi:hypothetical protein
MRAVGVLLLILGAFGVVASFTMFGDIESRRESPHLSQSFQESVS